MQVRYRPPRSSCFSHFATRNNILLLSFKGDDKFKRPNPKPALSRLVEELSYILDLNILTHLSLASLLWDIGKQDSPRCDAAERGVPSGAILFAQRNFIEKCDES